mmetsp:Transcript_12382/g.18017  ORF Transcript_12382/g.18017 Transcript_12382/m.18017 type:complete len:161 (-) Transcript_12382:32-514(-)|eukprot:CAMPEP_0197257890 /NCGR_PEP_ID=MMETSP1429-20130617/80274_1 /TAXON_ID=49237 /ORGANISM="Chaetoceros  sp., Strain UNC1202" /LENGTH=160 /DNA_ID=CAMNT_0042721857 /DNA_START=177 /DNA_END=659 /DNA_ORIENTATION=-
MLKACSFLLLPISSLAFTSPLFGVPTQNALGLSPSSLSMAMRQIVEGVEFDTIAREWRCKFSSEGNMASLVALQMALETVVDDLKEVEGVQSIERVVCGDCLDFKVITSVSADNFDAWTKQKYDPEEYFMEMLEVIDGVSEIDVSTYTKMPVMSTEFLDD